MVVGVGPGSPDYLTPAAQAAVGAAEVILGGRQSLALFPDFPGEVQPLTAELPKALAFLRERAGRPVAVLLSGDPGFYSWLGQLRREFSPAELRVIPGVSSLQVLAARGLVLWPGLHFFSLHGREEETWLGEVAKGQPVALLTGPDWPPSRLAERLVKKGLGESPLLVGVDLTLPTERLWRGPARNYPGPDGPEGAVVIIGQI